MKYRTEIDGLRALAVVPVILFHAGLAFSMLFGFYGYKADGFKERFNSAQDFGAYFRLPMRWKGFCFYSFNDRNLDLGEDGVKCELGIVSYPIDTFTLKY